MTCIYLRGQGILNEVWKHKLIFVETPDANETSIALENYRRVSVCPPLLALTQMLCRPGLRQWARCGPSFSRSRQGVRGNRFRPQLWSRGHHVWVRPVSSLLAPVADRPPVFRISIQRAES